jgi:hypothetical protein
VDFLINEPRPLDRAFFSHKFKHAGLRYEIGLSFSGKIIWVNGGVPCGSTPDLTLARTAFTGMLGPGEKAMADKGYRDGHGDDSKFVTPIENPYDAELRAFNRSHKRYMARHETVNKRVKQFFVLRHQYRHDLLRHRDCFNAVINVTCICLEKEPLWDCRS